MTTRARSVEAQCEDGVVATRHLPAPVPGPHRWWARGRWRRGLVAVSAVALLAVAPVTSAPATAQGTTTTDVTSSGTTPGTTPGGGPFPSGGDRSGPTPRDVAEAACAAPGRPLIAVGPAPVAPYLDRVPDVADATFIDSRGSQIDSSSLDRSGFGIAVRIRRGTVGEGVCFVGGSLRTNLDPENTPWKTWHRVTAMAIEAPGFQVVGTAFRNQGDLLAFLRGADDWHVVGVRAEGGSELPGAYGHDDCIENDTMLSGVVEDSKFDGCFTFMSSTEASEKRLDGTGHEVVVRGSLVRLQPFRNSFNVPKYGENGHGGFFKWAPPTSDVMIPPALSVSDSMFRSDDRARYGGNVNGFLGLPPGTRCERVVLIGTEAWTARDLASWQDQCTDLRLGTVADWDAAVAAWDAAHPPMLDVAGQARATLAAGLSW
jgi:hypothetical protein